MAERPEPLEQLARGVIAEFYRELGRLLDQVAGGGPATSHRVITSSAPEATPVKPGTDGISCPYCRLFAAAHRAADAFLDAMEGGQSWARANTEAQRLMELLGRQKPMHDAHRLAGGEAVPAHEEESS